MVLPLFLHFGCVGTFPALLVLLPSVGTIPIVGTLAKCRNYSCTLGALRTLAKCRNYSCTLGALRTLAKCRNYSYTSGGSCGVGTIPALWVLLPSVGTFPAFWVLLPSVRTLAKCRNYSCTLGAPSKCNNFGQV